MMTSQTYSLNPTSTSASAYSTPTDVNDPNDSDGESLSSLLSSGGSSPLIVAFLAIGLFIVMMLGVFVWRRTTHSRRVPVHPQLTTNGQPKPNTPIKAPILCDVWADAHVQEKPPLGVTRWENMTPVAALLTCRIPPTPNGERRRYVGSVDPGGRVLCRRGMGYLVSAVRRFYAGPATAERDGKGVGPPTSEASDAIAWGDTSSLQVSVIIAMPTQRRCRSEVSDEAVDAEGMALGEFCIGTMDVSWSECG